jgi:membrane protein YqaA with SNARE-associated domain
VFASRTLNPRVHLVFLLLWTAGASIGLLVALVAMVGNVLGGSTTATVGRVYSQVGYTVTFTTKYGTNCQTLQKWGDSPVPIQQGDTIEVHYSRFSPCYNVERADDSFSSYGFLAIPTIMVAGGLIAITRLRRDHRQSAETP